MNPGPRFPVVSAPGVPGTCGPTVAPVRNTLVLAKVIPVAPAAAASIHCASTTAPVAESTLSTYGSLIDVMKFGWQTFGSPARAGGMKPTSGGPGNPGKPID